MTENLEHKSVLLQEVLHFLDPKPDGIYVDGTVGGGGHSLEIAKRLDPAQGRLIALDLDPAALEAAKQRLKAIPPKIDFVQANYKNLDQVLKKLSVDHVEGVLLDLGFSSLQINNPRRGFSFQTDAPLDMRFSPDQPLTAREIVNAFSQSELIRIIKDFGEERWAFRIAAEIVRSRAKRPIETTHQLVELIEKAIPQPAQRKAYQSGSAHPATRTFQALRIAVNDELENVAVGLQVAFDALKPEGRLVVITFHSLEDRIVKQFMKRESTGCTCPPDLPVCVCRKKPAAEHLGEASPTAQELAENQRARSARLRAIKKL